LKNEKRRDKRRDSWSLTFKGQNPLTIYEATFGQNGDLFSQIRQDSKEFEKI